MNRKLIWAIALFVVAYFSIGSIADFYVDYEWFRINNGTEMFWVLFFSKFNVGLVFTIIFVALFFLNFLLIRLLGGKGRIFTHNILDRLRIPVLGSPRKVLFLLMGAGVIAVGIIMGSAASVYWKEYLMYSNAVPFSSYPADPVFSKDMGFFIFSLPFYQFLYGWAMSSLVIITIFSVFFHILNGGIILQRGVEFSPVFQGAHIHPAGCHSAAERPGLPDRRL
jgi:uncharacterized membrane protein (UPF0182 family)